jgi:hypothetical protein
MKTTEYENDTGGTRPKPTDSGELGRNLGADRLKNEETDSLPHSVKAEAAADLKKEFSGDALCDRNRFGSLANPEQARRNEDHARQFVAGRTSDPAKVDEKLQGMNFARDVQDVKLQPGDIVYRYQSQESYSMTSSERHAGESLRKEADRPPEGGWFAPSDSTAERLGIVGITADSIARRSQREAYVVTREVTVLASTSKDVPSWYTTAKTETTPDGNAVKSDNGRPTGELLFGGATQFFAGDRKEDLSAFSRVVDPQRRKMDPAS